jgi:hypothetical protein
MKRVMLILTVLISHPSHAEPAALWTLRDLTAACSSEEEYERAFCLGYLIRWAEETGCTNDWEKLDDLYDTMGKRGVLDSNADPSEFLMATGNLSGVCE